MKKICFLSLLLASSAVFANPGDLSFTVTSLDSIPPGGTVNFSVAFSDNEYYGYVGGNHGCVAAGGIYTIPAADIQGRTGNMFVLVTNCQNTNKFENVTLLPNNNPRYDNAKTYQFQCKIDLVPSGPCRLVD